MESREKCEQIISMFNNKPLGGPGPGSYQPLVVKFADGGTSRRKTAVSSPDPTWSGQASTDGSVSVMAVNFRSELTFQENALSPESRHSNGSAIGLGANGSPVVSFAYGGPGTRMPGPGYTVMTPSRMMSPASATGPPLMAGGPGGAWVPTSSGSYIIQSPTAPMNPIEVFQLSPSGESHDTVPMSSVVTSDVPVDPYTCLVSGMHGLALGGPGGGGPGAPPGAQFVQGPLGYPGMCLINPGPGYASLPNIEPQPGHINPAASPIEESQQQPERGQSN